MRKIFKWFTTPFSDLPWWQTLVVGVAGGFLIGITIGSIFL
jgi:hypothetical protein